MATQYARQSYGPPPGWFPPYQGAPPIPAGVKVNPQQWQMGSWQFNPAYNPMQRPSTQHVPWVPGQAWPQAQQHQQANYNPYKRIPKPPSAEYMATELSDNPLGLTNMIPAEELYANSGAPDSGDSAPLTPWIWNPGNLEEEDESDQGATAADGRDSQGRRRSLDTSSSSTHSRHNRPSDAARPRQLSEPAVSNSYRLGHDSRNARHATEPAPNGRRSADLSRDAVSSSSLTSRDVLPHLDRPLDRPKDLNSQYYRRRYPEGYQSAGGQTQRSSEVPSTSSDSHRREESFTSKRDLRPTFSPNIVRTPGHYITTPPTRSSSSGSSRDHSQSSLDSLSTRMDRLSMSSTTSGSVALTRHSSMPTYISPTSGHGPSSSVSDASTYVDEPSSMLSPLMLGATPKPSTRSIGRNASVPSIGAPPALSTIPEAPPSTRGTSAHYASQSYSTSPEPSPSPNRRTFSRGPSPRHSPPRHTPPRTSPAVTPPYAGDSQHHITPSTAGRHTSNPLPPPPMEIRYVPMPPPPQQGPPPKFRERIRKGFWNRRGDHVTLEGYVVYAPPGHAYPSELKDYPAEDYGYKDNFGTILAYNETRPELPESLPRHGHPPLQPYENFLVYDYRP